MPAAALLAPILAQDYDRLLERTAHPLARRAWRERIYRRAQTAPRASGRPRSNRRCMLRWSGRCQSGWGEAVSAPIAAHAVAASYARPSVFASLAAFEPAVNLQQYDRLVAR
jgi:hypothetical protein